MRVPAVVLSGFYIIFQICIYIFLVFNVYAANYLDNWKCIAVLKGDGSSVQDKLSQQASGSYGSSAGTSNGSATTRYYKLGNITSANQVAWH